MWFFQFSISSRFAETEEKTENSSICRSSRSYCKSRADLGVWKGEWRCEITFNIKKEVYRHCSSQTALVFDLVLQSDRFFCIQVLKFYSTFYVSKEFVWKQVLNDLAQALLCFIHQQQQPQQWRMTTTFQSNKNEKLAMGSPKYFAI